MQRAGVIGASKVAHDISDRKRAEAALQQSEESLRQADRRKDEFLAMLAHELRNPLAPLRNSLEILKLADGDAELLEQARETMDRQLSHLERLVDDLLDVSRITRDKLELRTPAGRARIDRRTRPSRPAGRWSRASGTELDVDTAPRSRSIVDADPVRLAQVFSNLLNNACKYTEPGGQISLSADDPARGEVVVRVKDNGIGIPAEMLPRVFEHVHPGATVARSVRRAGWASA